MMVYVYLMVHSVLARTQHSNLFCNVPPITHSIGIIITKSCTKYKHIEKKEKFVLKINSVIKKSIKTLLRK